MRARCGALAIALVLLVCPIPSVTAAKAPFGERLGHIWKKIETKCALMWSFNCHVNDASIYPKDLVPARQFVYSIFSVLNSSSKSNIVVGGRSRGRVGDYISFDWG